MTDQSPPPIDAEQEQEQGQTQQRKPRPNFGCLGCFWSFCLVLCTCVAVGALWWLNPMWFDRMAFWRGPVLSDDPIFVVADVSDTEAVAREAEHERAEDKIEFWEDARVSADYDTMTGGRVQTIEGTTIQFPPGALVASHRIEAVPVTHLPESILAKADGIAPIGPLHDVRIDGAAHTVFKTPVRVRVPYLPNALPPGVEPQQLRIGSYSNGKWETVPSRVDMAGKFVEGEVKHASVVGAVLIGAGVTAIAHESTETVRTLAKIVRHSQTYATNVHDTKNFSVYYGNQPFVVSDDLYPLAGERPSGNVPLYVQDVGRWLEEYRAKLGEVGMKVGPGTPHRWGVFLIRIPSFGSTDLGGPVVLHNTMADDGKGFPDDYEYRVHNTIVHELIHVAQDNFFTNMSARGQDWWMESSAEYLSNEFLRSNSGPEGDDRYYVRNRPDLLEVPIDEASGTQPYAFAKFYEWIEQQDVNAVAAIKRANETGAPSLPNVDKGFGGRLSEHFVGFAKDYCHNNLWTNRYATPEASDKEWSRRHPFTSLGTEVNGAMRLYSYSDTRLPMRHFTATYRHFHIPSLPSDVDTKLVIHFANGGGATDDHFVFTSPVRARRTFPMNGSPSPLERVDLSAENAHVVYDITGSTRSDGKKASYVALLAINAAIKGDGPSLDVRRWLLLPPENGSFKRVNNDEHYELTWQEAILKQQDRRQRAFKGYNIYRRESSEDDFPESPLNDEPLAVERWTDEAVPDNKNFVYGVTVVDKLDNESDIRELDNEDPFEGVWHGKVILVSGDLAEPLERWAKKEHEEDRRDYQRRISEASNATTRTRLQRRWEEKDREFQDDLAEWIPKVDAFEELARLGIPMSIRVTLRDGKYLAQTTRLMGVEADADDDDASAMRRNGNALITDDTPEEMPPLVLRLHRKDEINSMYEWSVETEVGTLRYRIRFHLKRE